MKPVRRLYDRLLAVYGPQAWWPAESPLEVIVGAVLVQRTAWRNAELALDNLRRAGLLDQRRLLVVDRTALAQLIRPAGFWRLKSERLTTVMRAVNDAGGIEMLAKYETGALRTLLLSLRGIGEETADTILLYAFGRPVAVVDAYLRRVASRLSGAVFPSSGSGDSRLRQLMEDESFRTAELNEFHALIVAHGQAHCRTAPLCKGCCVADLCRYGGEGQPGGYSGDQTNPSLRRK